MLKIKKSIFYLLFTLFFLSGCVSTPEERKDTSGGSSSVSSTATYSVMINGKQVEVVRIDKFDVVVNYVRIDFPAGGCDLEIRVLSGNADGFTLSPKSKGITPNISGDKISFRLDEPGYFLLQKSGAERLFILIDPPEVNPPKLSDPDVKNIMDYPGMDNTGSKDITEIIQNAINEASTSTKNILYFPEGKYKAKFLSLKDNVTLYFSSNAQLLCSISPDELSSHLSGHTIIENCSYGFILMNGVRNAKIIGRGTIDGNGKFLKQSERKMFLVKIENSSDCLVEGIISRDSCFWNTLIYRSSNIIVSNYKVINNRLASEWNETDGVNFDNCVNCLLYNAFLYTGDDSMAVKSDDLIDGETYTTDPTTGPYINVSNIVHRKVVLFSGSAGCKVGTKTYGETMTDIVFDDIDIITARRGLVIDGVDKALINGTVFKNIRIEKSTGNLIDFNIDVQNIFWRTALGLCTISNTTVSNVFCYDNKQIRMLGTDHNWITNTNAVNYGKTNYVDGVTFIDFYIQNKKITNFTDASFNTNQYVRNVSFY